MSKALCVATKCTTKDQFVESFYRFCDEHTFFVATLNQRPIGLETPFSINLADRTPMLRGLCVVLEAWATPANPFGRPGIKLGIKRLTTDSEDMFAKLAQRRGNAAPPTAPAATPVAPTPAPVATKLGSTKPFIPPIPGPASTKLAPPSATAPTERNIPPTIPNPLPEKPGTGPGSDPALLGKPGTGLGSSPVISSPGALLSAKLAAAGAAASAAKAAAVQPVAEDPPTKPVSVQAVVDDPPTMPVSVPDKPLMPVVPSVVAQIEQRTPGSDIVLPANPLMNLTDESLEGFVDCTVYEETGNFFQAEIDPATGEPLADGDIAEPPPPDFSPMARRPTPPSATMTAAQAIATSASDDATSNDATSTDATSNDATSNGATSAPPAAPDTTRAPAAPDTTRASANVDAAAIADAAPVPSSDDAAPGAPPQSHGTLDAYGQPQAPYGQAQAPYDQQGAYGQGPYGQGPYGQGAAYPQSAPGYYAPAVAAPRARGNRRTLAMAGGAAALSAIVVFAFVQSSSTEPAIAAKQLPDTTPKTAEVEHPDPAPSAPSTAPSTAATTPSVAPHDEPAGPTTDTPDEGDVNDEGEGDDSTPPPSSGDLPLVGTGPCRLDVTTTPAGTKVVVDDKELGPSPISIAGPCEKHKVELIHPRYKQDLRFITLAEGAPKKLDVTLIRPTHHLVIKTTPPGATISIQGRRAGTSPATVALMGFSGIDVTISRQGYETVTKRVYSKKPNDKLVVTLKRYKW